MKQTYEQRARALAEKMAKDYYGELFDRFPDSEKESDINDYMGTARIAVAETANSVTQALEELLPTDGIDYSEGDNKYVINGYLLSNGLIPDDGQEDVEDE